MLNDLNILNGELSLKFDPLNTIYTVNLTNNDLRLDLNYDIDDNDKISIYGNDLKEGLNEVVLTVYNDKEMMSYYLYVYKNKEKTVSNISNNEKSLELTRIETFREYAVPVISSVCFLFILLFFTLIFKKKKNY